jgi:NADH:ubiquinone oxidoreductase subunit K
MKTPAIKKTAKVDDFEYLLERSRENQQQNKRIIFILIGIGLVTAFLSVSLNLNAIQITKLEYGGIAGSIRNLFFLRLFLTTASVGCGLALLYYKERDKMIASMTEFLAVEKKYERARILSEFFTWSENIGNHIILKRLFVLQSFVLAGLLVVLPVGTLLFALVRK